MENKWEKATGNDPPAHDHPSTHGPPMTAPATRQNASDSLALRGIKGGRALQAASNALFQLTTRAVSDVFGHVGEKPLTVVRLLRLRIDDGVHPHQMFWMSTWCKLSFVSYRLGNDTDVPSRQQPASPDGAPVGRARRLKQPRL